MESDRQLSIYVSRALDCLGKSHDMAKFRVECYKQEERYFNSFGDNSISVIIAGSKGEGLTTKFESDLDIMSVQNYMICAENTAPFRSLPGLNIVFEADRRNTSPGYTKLKLNNHFWATIINLSFKNALFEDSYGNFFLSSDGFVESFINRVPPAKYRILLERSGPSLPTKSSIEDFSQDFVQAFLCFFPQIQQSFIARHRNHGWPTNDQLTEIANLEGHVVPVGNKGSQTDYLEWRICYTKTERFLMRSLNDTQTKIYILLKMIAKTYINLVSKEITSYVLKNIVLWQAEFNNIDTFKEELLVNRLIQALDFLRKCITNNYLPSYMIPERNLFSEKLGLVQRQQLVILLTELIHEGGGLLMRCERLRGTIFVLYTAPILADQFRLKRDVIEKLFMWKNKITFEKRTFSASELPLCCTDATYLKILLTLKDLIMPDLRFLVQHGCAPVSLHPIFKTRLRMWLS